MTPPMWEFFLRARKKADEARKERRNTSFGISQLHGLMPRYDGSRRQRCEKTLYRWLNDLIAAGFVDRTEPGMYAFFAQTTYDTQPHDQIIKAGEVQS